jgi:ABC-type phosphate transport system permease subunit
MYYARTGIIGAIMLGFGRALGETMAVTMVIGNTPQISLSLLAPQYTMAAVLANEFSEAADELYLDALDRGGPCAVHHHAHREHRLPPVDLEDESTGGEAKDGGDRDAGGADRMNRDTIRRVRSTVVVWLSGLAVLLALVPLVMILFFVVARGVFSLNLAFFTHLPAPVGEIGGGMANSIVAR